MRDAGDPTVLALATEDPEAIGGWTILGRIGAGGMATVYLGEQRGQRAAVKAMHPDLSHRADARARFAQEIRAGRIVTHPHCAHYVDADPTAARPWLASRYVPGLDLERQIEQHGPMGRAELVQFAAQLAGGVAAIHAVGITHRDLKPSNIIVGPNGPVIVDFGIARGNDDTIVTRTGQLVGTPAFMAPEQFDRRSPGPAADVFAWAGIICVAATGHRPFESGSVAVLTHHICHGPPDLTGLTEPILGLCTLALHKDSSVRPTAAQLHDGLETGRLSRPRSGTRSASPSTTIALGSRTSVLPPPSLRSLDAMPPSPPHAPTPHVERRKVRVATGAAIALLVAAATTLGLRSVTQHGSNRAAPEPNQPSVTRPSVHESLGRRSTTTTMSTPPTTTGAPTTSGATTTPAQTSEAVPPTTSAPAVDRVIHGTFDTTGPWGLPDPDDPQTIYQIATATHGPHGDIYIADSGDDRIKRIDATTGAVSLVAGTDPNLPATSDIGDGGPATAAQLGPVDALAVDSHANVYFADAAWQEVRKVDASTGAMTRVTWTAIGDPDSTGGDALFVDRNDNLTIATGTVVKRRDRATGHVATVAENVGYDLNAITVDPTGTTWVAADNQVLRIDGITHAVTRAAGAADNEPGFSGDGGPAVQARLDSPAGLAVAPDGRIWIADTNNDRIRILDPATHVITSRPTPLPIQLPEALSLTSSGTCLVTSSTYDTIAELRL